MTKHTLVLYCSYCFTNKLKSGPIVTKIPSDGFKVFLQGFRSFLQWLSLEPFHSLSMFKAIYFNYS